MTLYINGKKVVTGDLAEFEGGTNETTPIVDIKQTPSTATTNRIVRIIAEGANWSANAALLSLQSNDTDAVCVEGGTTASPRTWNISRAGTFTGSAATLSGDITLTGGGSVVTTSDGNITLLPNGSGITIVGDAGSTSHTFNTNDDLFVAGRVEVDGILYADAAIQLPHAGPIYLAGSSIASDTTLYGDTIRDQTVLSLGTNQGLQLVIAGDTPAFGRDYDHATPSTPTVFYQSDRDPSESNMEYGSFTHDGDDVIHSVGKGGHVFKTDAQKARGTVTFTGIPVADETMVINATTLTWKADGSGNIDHVTIGVDAAECVTNLVATLAECTEAANLSAWDGAGDTVVIEWGTAGVAGNAIVFTEACTNVTVDGAGTLGTTHAGLAAATLLDVDQGGTTTATTMAATTVNVSGNVELTGGGSITTTSNGALDLAPNGSGNITYTPGASSHIVIDAATTPHTDTSGVIDVNVEAGATGVSGLDFLMTSKSGGLGSGQTIYGININMAGDASDNAACTLATIHGGCDATGSGQRWCFWADGTNWDYGFYTDAPIFMNATNIETDTTTGCQIGTASNQKLSFYGVATATQPAHVADPAACAAMTFSHSWDGATDPTQAEGDQLVADLAACKAAIDANNAAIDSILAQLATLGLQAAS